MPGVRICRFALTGRDCDAPDHIPVCGEPLHFEVFYCLQGRLMIQPVYGEVYVVEAPGVLLLSDCGGLRACRCSGNLGGILVAVDAKAAGESLRSVCTTLGLEVDVQGVRARMAAENGYMVLAGIPWTEAFFSQSRSLSETGFDRYSVLKTMELLYLLCAQAPRAVLDPHADGYIRPEIWKVKAYIQAHLSEKLTIQHLCRQFSISPTLLKEGFRRAYGVPIHSWLMEQRMQRARELVYTTALPIGHIAQMVGYEGTSQFHTAFKRYYDMTPGQLRKMSETEIKRPF